MDPEPELNNSINIITVLPRNNDPEEHRLIVNINDDTKEFYIANVVDETKTIVLTHVVLDNNYSLLEMQLEACSLKSEQFAMVKTLEKPGYEDLMMFRKLYDHEVYSLDFDSEKQEIFTYFNGKRRDLSRHMLIDMALCEYEPEKMDIIDTLNYSLLQSRTPKPKYLDPELNKPRFDKKPFMELSKQYETRVQKVLIKRTA